MGYQEKGGGYVVRIAERKRYRFKDRTSYISWLRKNNNCSLGNCKHKLFSKCPKCRSNFDTVLAWYVSHGDVPCEKCLYKFNQKVQLELFNG